MAKKTPEPDPVIVDAPLPPIEPEPDHRNLVICDAQRQPVIRIAGDPRFRITWQGCVYEHCGADADGRWLYAPTDL